MKKQYRSDMIETVAAALCCPQGCAEGVDGRPCLRDTYHNQAWDALHALDKAQMLVPSPIHKPISSSDLNYLRWMIGTAESRVRDVAEALEAQQDWIKRLIGDETPQRAEGDAA